MSEIKKSRVEFVYDLFCQLYEKADKKDKLLPQNELTSRLRVLTGEDQMFDLTTREITSDPEEKIDISFLSYALSVFPNGDFKSYQNKNTFKDVIFQYFLDFDPTKNKEYLSWFINLYGGLVKNRPQIHEKNVTGENFRLSTFTQEIIFFEDFGKIADAIETFNFIKKTNILTEKQRDINRYDNYHDFVNTIKPYTVDDDDDNSHSIHTLSPSEIKCIQNFVNDSSETSLAELVYENDKWVIVITHDKESNAIFGKNTTWCTAGTRHLSMFDNYNNRGPLFVLIKKGFGSKKCIMKDPNVRLQFHFESNQYMEAMDKSIDIANFLVENGEIKEFFRKYVIRAVRKLTGKNNTGQIISFLTKLGYIDELIPILKESKATSLDLTSMKLGDELISRLGEITTLEELILKDCSLTKIPETYENLVNLKTLRISGNLDLQSIPAFINKLTNLKSLDASFCDITGDFEISELINLEHLILDSNKKLNHLPHGLKNCKLLTRLSASDCDIKILTDDVLELNNLFLLDLHKNKDLTYINPKIGAMERIRAINVDRCNIEPEIDKQIKHNAINKTIKCSYCNISNNLEKK